MVAGPRLVWPGLVLGRPMPPGSLRPLLKGETLKKWLGDISEKRSRAQFQNSLEERSPFAHFFEKGSIFKLCLKKYPIGALGPGPWPEPAGPWPGLTFQKTV